MNSTEIRSDNIDEDGPRLRVLIVSFLFPPYNVIGAVRVGKTAKYLRKFGHDIRVIAAKDLPLDRTLELEIPASDVVYTPWYDVDAPYRTMLRVRKTLRTGTSRIVHSLSRVHSVDSAPAGSVAARALPDARKFLGLRTRLLYTDLVHVPDDAIGWHRFAVRAGQKVVRAWRPDVILASGAPWTSFIVARDLSKFAGVPWVADFRDLWIDNTDLIRSRWRTRVFDSPFERRLIQTASDVVTVSEPLADQLRARHRGKPVHVILNGFDANDYEANGATRRVAQPVTDSHPLSWVARTPPKLRLVYTGQMYRSMVPLIDAIPLLGRDAEDVVLELIGISDDGVRQRYSALASARGIMDQVKWLPAVSHAEAAKCQQNADILFLLVHDNDNDARIYTGKLFEYIGARRPILIVGTRTGVAASLVRERGLGEAEATPDAISVRLRSWLEEKRRTGIVAPPVGGAIEDLSRESQTRAFAKVLWRASRSRVGAGQ